MFEQGMKCVKYQGHNTAHKRVVFIDGDGHVIDIYMGKDWNGHIDFKEFIYPTEKRLTEQYLRKKKYNQLLNIKRNKYHYYKGLTFYYTLYDTKIDLERCNVCACNTGSSTDLLSMIKDSIIEAVKDEIKNKENI